MSKSHPVNETPKTAAGWKRYVILGGLLTLALVAFGVWQVSSRASEGREAPEAEHVLAVQAKMPFQILIPAYLPRQFNRKEVEISFNELGPGGEPMVQLAYKDRSGGTVCPVQTGWGIGWLLKQGESLAALWVDVGPLRVSIYSPFQNVITVEEILQAAETLGPASNQQVFSFVVDLPQVRSVEPPPPFEVPLSEAGIQEFTLVVTPGGYDPLRFQVKPGVPVRMNFRAIGQVGCGQELIFPVGRTTSLEAKLKSNQDSQVIEFTPTETGVFEFHCSHQMYRGLMTVAP
jgi:hypothetical protein